MPTETLSLDTIQTYLMNEIRNATPPNGVELDGDTSFSSMGLDSMTQVSLIGKLEERFEVELDPTLAYDYPTVNALSKKLDELLVKG